MNKKSLTFLAMGVATTCGLGIALAMPASADHGGGSSRQGHCSMRSTWELKASNDGDGLRRDDHGHHHGIEVEFRIRTGNDRGDLWTWMISDNGSVVKQGDAHARRGDDSVERRPNIPNLNGPDTIVLNATDTVSGETCQGQVVMRGGDGH